MALRAMNNKEKAAVALLKEKGFHIFWQYRNGERDGDYWATHTKLIGQYHVGTATDEAIQQLKNAE